MKHRLSIYNLVLLSNLKMLFTFPLPCPCFSYQLDITNDNNKMPYIPHLHGS